MLEYKCSPSVNNASFEEPLLVSLPPVLKDVQVGECGVVVENGLSKKKIELECRPAQPNLYVGEMDRSTGKLTLGRKIKSTARPGIGDFLLPSFASSQSFFSSLSSLLSGDVCSLPDEFFNDFSKSGEAVPFFPISTVTHSGVFKQYNFKEFTSERKKVYLAQKIRVEESPPAEPEKTLEKTVQRLVGKHTLKIKKSLEEAFRSRRVWPIKEMESWWSANCAALFQNVKWSSAKNVLPLVAYTYATGPWKKLWVKYGYNPTRDPLAYKYQVYMWKNVSKAFVIMDNPEILQLISSDACCTTAVFSPKTGFITPEGYSRIYKALSDMAMPQYVSTETQGRTPSTRDLPLLGNLDLDFETLDD
ncbi:hypothetical protein NECID01_0519 [Nematocida sp. AWRm77]|nr:hypothetical protein NECID01_0519 [Nematocida sp. AWRm77]